MGRLSPNPSYLSLKLDPSKSTLDLNSNTSTAKFGKLSSSMQVKKGMFGEMSRNYLNVGLAPTVEKKKTSFMEYLLNIFVVTLCFRKLDTYVQKSQSPRNDMSPRKFNEDCHVPFLEQFNKV
jgi:hypothetical protein